MSLKVATAILTHAHPELTADTVDAVETWVGDRNVILVDEGGWDKFKDVRIGRARIEKGFLHAFNRGPYRNSALALQKLYEFWPDSDWFLYTEYDCLFTSDGFLADLTKADEVGAWCAGVDLRRHKFDIPMLQALLGQGVLQHSYYFLGCCLFLSRRFVQRLHETGFIRRLLNATRDFTKGHFPGYQRWAFEEELWPTSATALGGKLYELASFKGVDQQWQPRIENDPRLIYSAGENEVWRGPHNRYPIRFSPEISATECTVETAIVHPSKRMEHPIRELARVRRDAIRRGAPIPE